MFKQKLENKFDFKNIEEYWQWAKNHIFAQISKVDDYVNVEVHAPKQTQEGTLDADAYLSTTIKDKLEGGSIVIRDVVKKYVEDMVLETAASMHLSPLEYIKRQRYRFSNVSIQGSIERPKQREFLEEYEDMKVYIGTRSGEETEFAKQKRIPDHVTVEISLNWV